MRQPTVRSHRRPRGTNLIGISVDNQHCHLYGICVAEAPELFTLTSRTRLRYSSTVDQEHADGARAAARRCPMRAIHLSEERVP